MSETPYSRHKCSAYCTADVHVSLGWYPAWVRLEEIGPSLLLCTDVPTALDVVRVERAMELPSSKEWQRLTGLTPRWGWAGLPCETTEDDDIGYLIFWRWRRGEGNEM